MEKNNWNDKEEREYLSCNWDCERDSKSDVEGYFFERTLEVRKLKKENEQLKEENKKLTEENKELNEENKKLIEGLHAIYSISGDFHD